MDYLIQTVNFVITSSLIRAQAGGRENVWISLSSGLIGAILGAIIAAIATVNIQHWRIRKNYLREQQFKIYMLLHDVYSKHFWIASSDIRGELASDKIRREYEAIRWKIADEVRTIDRLPESATILYTLFSLRFENENDRARALEKLLDEMGKELNPNYSKVMKQLSEENMQLHDLNEFFKRRDKIEPQ